MLLSFFIFLMTDHQSKSAVLVFKIISIYLFLFNLTVRHALQRMEKCYLDINVYTIYYCEIHYNALLCKKQTGIFFFVITSFKQFIMHCITNLFRTEIMLLWHVLLISFLQIEQNQQYYLIVKIPSS